MIDALIIRPSDAGDIAAVDALLARAYPRLLKADYPPSILVTALPLISRARPELLVCGTYYVAEIGGGIVGAGGWTRAGRNAGIAEIRHVVTDDRRTRQGIGRTLMTRIFAEAGAVGVTLLACQATRTAVPFYQAMGFSVLGPVEVPLRPGISFPAIRMQRRL